MSAYVFPPEMKSIRRFQTISEDTSQRNIWIIATDYKLLRWPVKIDTSLINGCFKISKNFLLANSSQICPLILDTIEPSSFYVDYFYGNHVKYCFSRYI